MIVPITKTSVSKSLRRLLASCPAIRQKRCFAGGPEECEKSTKSEDERTEKNRPSMWEKGSCDNDASAASCDVYRHDVLFLKKSKRKYTRTWEECEPFMKCRYTCVGDILPPEVEIRPRHVRKALPKPKNENLDLLECHPKKKDDSPCPRIKMPGCKPMKLTRCAPVINTACCQKRCTLYPSYSECKHPKPKVEKPTECKCSKVPPMCEIYAMFRKYSQK